jgi:hypothetical protein
MLSVVYAECYIQALYVECRLCLRVTYKTLMLSVIILRVTYKPFMLSVVMLSVVAP